MQFGQSVIEIPLQSIPASPLCPVKALNNMFKNIPAPPNFPAFVVPHQGRMLTLTHTSYTNFLKHFLERCNIDSKSYSGHSFRSGGLQEAAKCHELNMSDLMTHGT